MKHFDPIELTRQFTVRAQDRARKELENVQQHDQRRRELKKEKAEQDESFDSVLAVALASPENVQAFHNKLNDFEQQAVERILTLQTRLDELMVKRQDMLNEAHVLPDGRRVFKSEDGKSVTDEFGEDVGSDIIRADEIDDSRPRSNGFFENKYAIDETKNSLDEAITFQEKIEDLRERSNTGELSKEELKALEQEFEDITPESFKPDDNPIKPEPDIVPVSDDPVESIKIQPMGIGTN